MRNIITLIFLFIISGSVFADNYTYLKGSQLIQSNQAIVSNGGTTQLDATSPMKTAITGSNTHIVKLPNASLLLVGTSFQILNKSTQTITVKDFSDVELDTLAPNTDKTYILFSGGLWQSSSGGSGGKIIAGTSPIVVNQDATTATISLGQIDYLDFNTATTPVALDGRLHFDQDDKTLSVDIDSAAGVKLQVGQEQYIRAVNKTGAPITNGSVVYISGAQGNRPTITKATAINDVADKTIGVVTQDIADNAEGMVTISGVVGDVNTTGYTTGDRLYLSSSVAGGLTKTVPTSNIVPVAWALNSTVSGKILIDVRTKLDNESLDPTGFIDNHLTTVTYDSVARTITLGGTVRALWRGVPVTTLTSGYVSPAHTATNGGWFLYYDGSTVQWSQTPWTFDKLMIAYVYYDGVQNIGYNETHGVMSWQAHREFHQTIGTYLVSGADLSAYTLNSTVAANRRPNIAVTVIADEDLQHTLNLLSSKIYTNFSLSGAGATGTFNSSASEIVPVSGARPYYNQFTGGAWQQTLMTNNAYQAIWLVGLPVDQSANSQKYRYVWIQGQSESTTLATIQGLTPASINLNGLANQEIVFLGKIIIRYTAGDWVITSVEKLTGNRYSQTAQTGGSFLSAVSTDSNFTGSGVASDPLKLATDITLSGYTYIGDSGTDGSFRYYKSGSSLIYEKRVSGSWTEIYRVE